MDPILGVFFAICLEYALFCFVSFFCFRIFFPTFVKPCHFFRQPNIQLGVICTYLCLQCQVLFCSFLQFPFIVLENVVLHVFDIFWLCVCLAFLASLVLVYFFHRSGCPLFALFFLSCGLVRSRFLNLSFSCLASFIV